MVVKLARLIVLLSSCCLPIATQSAALAIEGKYGRSGSPDSLELNRQPNGKFAVNLVLYYDNGHTCSLDSDAAKWVGDHLILKAPGIRAGEPCVLEFSFRNGQVELKDAKLRCTRMYCGTRGTFSGVKLARKAAK